MANYLNDDVLDDGLQVLVDDTENLYITSSVATTYAEALTAYNLGVKATPAFTGPADAAGGGRKVTIDAIADGTVSATGTAAYWALTDNSATKLLAAGPLDAGVAVVAGGTFTLTAIAITIPDVV